MNKHINSVLFAEDETIVGQSCFDYYENRLN